MRLAVTRPQQDSERTATALRARGHEVLVAPLMRVEPVEADLRANWGGVIITSANAAAAIAVHPVFDVLSVLPVFAVGRRSADAARQAGFKDITTAAGDVRDLIRIVAARRADAAAPLLYLAGEDRAGDLINDLALRGIAAELRIVYRAVAAPFPRALIAALKAGTIDAVLHFSKRSAENYLTGAAQAGISTQALGVRHLCLSTQIAEPIAIAGGKRIAIASRPDELALLELAETS
jgi:uroporphyrinogen-III synthase